MAEKKQGNNMKTVKEIIESKRLRKGPAHGITAAGAYWNTSKENHFAKLGATGGDGIGNNCGRGSWWLDFRHFRSGEIVPLVTMESWHQNYGTRTTEIACAGLLNCTTAEDVIAVLLDGNNDGPFLTHARIGSVTDDLVEFGLARCEPSPDNDAVV